MTFEPTTYLNGLGLLPDSDIDLALTAFAAALPDHPGLSIDRYGHHLDTLVQQCQERHNELLSQKGANDDANTRLLALTDVLHGQYGYTGDTQTYDDLDNTDLIRVIDRRKGLPVALSLLYIQTGKALNWNVQGINFPGHFICKIEKEGQRILFDPFDSGKILHAPDLRALIKKMQGDHAELSNEFYEETTNRQLLIRLLNNRKLRLIREEEYERAVRVVEMMRKIDLDEFRLFLDAGVLYARTGQPLAALRALETYIDRSPNPDDRREAAALLQEIRDQIH